MVETSKRLIAIVFATWILLTAIPVVTVPAITIPEIVNGDFIYTVSNQNATITGYTGDESELLIPDILDKYTVTSIGNYAFFGRSSLVSVTIPESVTNIGELAFGECYSLCDITIPKSVISIGAESFYDCNSLQKVFYGGTRDDRANMIFGERNSVINNAVWYYEIAGMGQTDGYTYMKLPNGTVSIIGYVEDASELVIPESIDGYIVTEIGENAFYGCESLVSVTIPNGVTNIGARAFCDCIWLVSVTIPKSAASIGAYAFYGCDWSLEVFYRGSCEDREVIAIAEGNESLYEALWHYETVQTGTENGFTYVINTDDTASVTGYVGDAIEWVIPDIVDGYTVTEIGNRAFLRNTLPVSVTIPEGVTSIGAEAFSGCSSLTSVTIPEGVTEIESLTFLDCSSLISIVIPEGVTSIGADAFNRCSSLESVTFPESLTSIGNTAFCECSSLTSVTIPESVTTVDDYTFAWCSSLESVTLPDGMTEIGEWAFSDCSSLTNIALPESVTSIGWGAFCDCPSLTDVYYAGSKKQWNDAVGGYDVVDSSTYVHYRATQEHWQFVGMAYEPTCTHGGEATYTCGCGYTVTKAVPAVEHNYVIAQVVEPTCTEEGYTLYRCTGCENTERCDFVMGAHTIRGNVCIRCELPIEECVASAHQYTNNTYQTWQIHQPNASTVTLTFSALTETDDGYDFIYIYDVNDTLIGSYTGKELAGAVVTVTGDTVKIRLVSDDSMVAYGFAVTNLTETVQSSGDFDGNGVLNMRDVMQLYETVSNGTDIADTQMTACDFDGNGIINMRDVMGVYKKVSTGA